MSRVFISYARRDLARAEELYAGLVESGHCPWLDKYDLEPGAKWVESIEHEIASSRYFLALLTTHSLTKRGFVQRELRVALNILDLYPGSQRFLIPVRLEPCKPRDARLAALHWIDLFPSYEAGFSRLVRSLGRRRRVRHTSWSYAIHGIDIPKDINRWSEQRLWTWVERELRPVLIERARRAYEGIPTTDDPMAVHVHVEHLLMTTARNHGFFEAYQRALKNCSDMGDGGHRSSASAKQPPHDRRRAGARSRGRRARASGAGPGGQKPSDEDAAHPRSLLEPPTHIVDSDDTRHFTTISDAVRAAHPGDRILVRPGRYDECVVIDKRLEILGDGRLDEIVVRASGTHVVAFSAPEGRIANLSLRQLGGRGKDLFGVSVLRGRLEVEGCDVTSQCGACIAIWIGASAHLSRNRIHDGRSSGIQVSEGGQGLLEDNEIFGNRSAGIWVGPKSSPTIRNNRIHGGESTGVFLSGRCIVEENDIFANGTDGVEISNANPTLRRNRIYRNVSAGIVVGNDGGGTLDSNEVFANATAEIIISGGSCPTLRDNRIYKSSGGGVILIENSKGTLEDNELFGNWEAQITIQGGSNPTVRHNHIHDGNRAGILIDQGGQGILEDNRIINNYGHGIQIDGASKLIVRRNMIIGNRDRGIAVSLGDGSFQDNDVHDNANGDWLLSRESRMIDLP